MNHLIAPSVLSADFARLEQDIIMINQSEADWFHVDVMDGVFVPNISFGMPVVAAISKEAAKPLDVHLMIVDPDRYIRAFKEAGADRISVHAEACTHLHRTIQMIHQEGLKAGVALNPHTSLSVLENLLHDIDMVVLMSVNPGFGGQQFIPQTMNKLRDLAAMRKESGASFLIQIDGGVNAQNAPELIEAGADVLVAGNFVFRSENPTQTIAQLKAL
ncbi:MAG: ribulose-phosphate 3-epimerase [Flavobacteriales bacterium]